jgi:outer membrane scaffolding protein for murein synthesis (MipA/OmpV family)
MAFSPGLSHTALTALLAATIIGHAGSAFAQAPASPSPPLPAEPSIPVAPPAQQPGLLDAGGALDSRTPDVVVNLRAGVQVSPAYFGSDDYEVGPDLAARVDYFRFPGGFEYGSSQTVGFRSGWGLQGSFRYLGERDSDKHDQIEGLDNVPWSAEAGLGVGYEQRNWRAFTDVRYGFVGHNTWVGEIGADAIGYPLEGLTLTLGPRLEFGSDRFAETYFGVSATESQASGLSEFDANGGLLGAGVEFGARYLFNERWGVEGAAGWQRLVNDAADSPVTATGSEDQYSFRLGITRRISLDF